ncbi:MAG: DHHW family protein [Clostridiales bacterium]|nr:DHHW family protein [Clostridiales bacterium]
MKKLYHFLPALVFLVFLAAMALLLLFSPVREYSENEKRYLAGRPEVSAENILSGEAQKELEKFTADQIPGRDFFVGVNAYWNLATGRNAAQDIYYCDEGYLINAPKQADEKIFTDNLTRFDQFAEKLGVPADLVMVPTTGYLMEEVLPAFHKEYQDDALYDLAGTLLENVRLVDVRDALKQGKDGGQICYRTDHHLTSYGNYLLYEAYQKANNATYLSRDAYEVTSYDGFYGTDWSGSGYWLVDPDTVEVWDAGLAPTVTLIDGGAEPKVSNDLFYLSHLENLDKYPIFLDGNHAMVTIHNPDAQGGNLLVIRDSYAHCLSTFLAADYQNIYLVDLRYYRQSVSEFVAEHPVDRVLYLYGMDNLITDTNSAWLQ